MSDKPQTIDEILLEFARWGTKSQEKFLNFEEAKSSLEAYYRGREREAIERALERMDFDYVDPDYSNGFQDALEAAEAELGLEDTSNNG